MIPYDYIEFIDDLTLQVENNIIPMSRINDAVRRILRVKFTMGLFENPYADLSLANELGKPVSSPHSLPHHEVIILVLLNGILFRFSTGAP